MSRSGFRRISFLLVLVLFEAVYAFSQAVRIPLTPAAAWKVSTAWDILRSGLPLTSWSYHPLELPVYLAAAGIFGLSTFAACFAALCFSLLLFTAGLWILYIRKQLTPLNVLIWMAVTGTPDTAFLEGVQGAPVLAAGLLFFSHFLASYFESREKKQAAAALISGAVLASAFKVPQTSAGGTNGFYRTLRTVQKVFGADFSAQPLMQISTARYFLKSVILLIVLFLVIRTVILSIRKRRACLPEIIFAAAIGLTFLCCALLFPDDPGAGTGLCIWMPYGGALLLAASYEHSSLKKTQIARHRIPFSAAAALFFGAAVCFGFSTPALSRPPGTADRIAAVLRENGLTRGCCDADDTAYFRTASKDGIRFTSDPADPENEFIIYRNEKPQTGISGNVIEIDAYRVMIIPGS